MADKNKLRFYVLKNKRLTEVTKENEERFFNEKKYRLNKDDVDFNADYVLILQYRPGRDEWLPTKITERYWLLISGYNVRRRLKGFKEISKTNSHLWMPKLQNLLTESYPHADLNTALNLVLTSGRITTQILDELINNNKAPLINALNKKRRNKLTNRYDSESKSLNDVLRSNFEIAIVESDFYAEFYDLSQLPEPSSDRDEYEFLYDFNGLSDHT